MIMFFMVIILANSSDIFKFKSVKKFWRDMNRAYSFYLDDMTGVEGAEYELLVYSSVPAMIETCVDSTDGSLIEEIGAVPGLVPVENANTTIHLLCQDTENNNGFTITVAEAEGVTINLMDSQTNVQGLFIVDKETRYLMYYAKLSEALELSGNLIMPFTGALTKVGNCAE